MLKAKTMNSLLRLKRFLVKLRRAMMVLRDVAVRPNLDDDEDRHDEEPESEVPEGHFTVLAGNGGERKRFVVGLKQLGNPAFLKLLEEAKEEYGSFRQEGALALPCPPQRLQQILQDELPC
ncbi:hypothetical protein Nepgr_025038 [Nepenthes gracilis]|uniref:Uncharacterized protein n=1 Tax=Nepenthes gracilis TaxID=150966 RepID=A0AAD3T4C2_NEPGR|nr:hypothetical protein Nepgr_025038 [Nepenthes gracilis]